MATQTLTYDIQLEIRNEITGQPHIHYFTQDLAKAQAFFFTAESITGAKLQAHVHLNLQEGDLIPCIPCREGGDFSSELYRARPMSEVRT